MPSLLLSQENIPSFSSAMDLPPIALIESFRQQVVVEFITYSSNT